MSPRSAGIANELGWIFEFEEDFDAAIAQYKKALLLEPNYSHAHYNIGFLLVVKQQYEEAIGYLEKAIELGFTKLGTRSGLIYAFARTGQTTKAKTELNTMIEKYNAGEKERAQDIAFAYIGFNEHQQALDWLEKAVTTNSLSWPLHMYPWNEIRDQPRFKEIERKFAEQN